MDLENQISNYIGPNTAGLAQRMYKTYENKSMKILEKNYVLSCTINQF